MDKAPWTTTNKIGVDSIIMGQDVIHKLCKFVERCEPVQSTGWLLLWVSLHCSLCQLQQTKQGHTDSYATTPQKLKIDTVGTSRPLCLLTSIVQMKQREGHRSQEKQQMRKSIGVKGGRQSMKDIKCCSACISDVCSANIWEKSTKEWEKSGSIRR